MKKQFLIHVGLIALVFVFFSCSVFAEDSPGKKIFIDSKCNVCHSIDSQGVAKKTTSNKPDGPPDLSNVGALHKADWMTKYLNKEEARNDKKHIKAWTGKKEDLEILVKWLETLKTEAKK